jgi:hypothetical protein
MYEYILQINLRGLKQQIVCDLNVIVRTICIVSTNCFIVGKEQI